MLNQIIKRDRTYAAFKKEKIVLAIFKAATAVGGNDFATAEKLANEVVRIAELSYPDGIAEVEGIQDIVEKVLIENGHAKTAKAFILYREKRRSARESNALIGATINMFTEYLNDMDWQINENANTQKSINGLNNYIREAFTKNYWLHEIYPEEIRNAHLSGEIHIHDLGFFGPYCAGWDLKQILMSGFGGVPGKVESKPPKHLRSFLGQIVNSTFTTQGESAGAQAWSSFDTYCAPFIRYDNLDYKTVKQALQEFIFNLNVPTRVGFQCPFSNLTFDIIVPSTLKDENVIIGGKIMNETYGDFQDEMNILNTAFCDVMTEGDSKGRVFTFPIPTINVTKDFDWESAVVEKFMDITCKYGIPYFSNYINSDLSPEDALSMCCRLRLDTAQLRKRGGGLFGSNPLTGSIGVVTINLPRLAYLSKTKSEFYIRLWQQMNISKNSLEIKRKIIEEQTSKGLYPYSANYLKDV
ncbi:MAG: ribonucleoside triphosphate reductase, partial [Eubacteriaceae bacterium]|nr:ribonucleoside triphosphate reductase [Eubacteriaceae bacterium]